MAESPAFPLPAPNRASLREEITERADTVWTRGSGRRPKTTVADRRSLSGARGRVAIVDGCRTPFIKSGTSFRDMDVIDLAGVATAELVTRTGLAEKEIDLAIFGTVLPGFASSWPTATCRSWRSKPPVRRSTTCARARGPG